MLKSLAAASPARMDERDGCIRRIVLTGATGFIGYHLQRELIACGHEIVALVRPHSNRSSHIVPGVKTCSASLTDGGDLEQAVAAADLVIYCAGSIRGRNAADFVQANVNGVRALAEAAVRGMPNPRLLLISSLAASLPNLSDYAFSKHAGEEIVRATAGLDWVIVRPPAVYGPGDREMRPVFKAIRCGLGITTGPWEQRLSLLYVADLACAVAAIVGQYNKCAMQLFEIDDGRRDGYGWPDIIAATRGLIPVLPVPIPRFILVAAARANLKLADLCGYAPMLTPGKVRELSHTSWLCNNLPLTARTNWVPRVQLNEGVRETFSSDAKAKAKA